MATLTVADSVEAGLLEALVAASAGGDQFVNDGKTVLIVKNANGSASRTVTFDVPNTDDFGVSGFGLDRAVVVAGPSTRIIGPFPVRKFNTAVGAFIVFTYSSEADLTIQAVRVTPV
jgi:hypothetical protein